MIPLALFFCGGLMLMGVWAWVIHGAYEALERRVNRMTLLYLDAQDDLDRLLLHNGLAAKPEEEDCYGC